MRAHPSVLEARLDDFQRLGDGGFYIQMAGVQQVRVIGLT